MKDGQFSRIGFVLVMLGFTAMVSSQDEEVITSSKVGECSLTVEVRSHTLRLRAHHPEGRNCFVDKDSMLSALSEAFSETGLLKFEGAFTSLFIGRLIDYPWLSQYLALTALKDKKWDAKRGKPLVLNVNQYVSGILSQKEIVTQIETIVAKSGYRVTGVSVEKVLSGGLREVPQYAGDKVAGLLPYDAQVWFRLEWKGTGREGSAIFGQWESISIENPSPLFATTLPSYEKGEILISFFTDGRFNGINRKEKLELTGKFRFSDNNLYFDIEKETSSLKTGYKFKENRLIIITDDGFTYTFQKKGNQ